MGKGTGRPEDAGADFGAVLQETLRVQEAEYAAEDLADRIVVVTASVFGVFGVCGRSLFVVPLA